MADLGPQAKLKRKQDYFGDVDRMVADSDDESDAGRRASSRCFDSARAFKKAKAVEAKSGGSNGLARSASDTHVGRMEDSSAMALQPRPATAKTTMPTLLVKSSTFSGVNSTGVLVNELPLSSGLTKHSATRKRDANIKLVPEPQQIFRGLHFYFFPPGDKHPARRMRITKASSFGAIWCKEWGHDVTHVIVDKGIEYGLLLKYLKLKHIPESIVLVSENYPSECICYRTMLDAKQRQFLVKGYAVSGPSSGKVPSIGSGSHGSDRSLSLKPAGKKVSVRPSGTPAADATSPP